MILHLNQIQDALVEVPPPLLPSVNNVKALIKDLITKCGVARHPDARELAHILRKPHVRALIEAHDEVGELVVNRCSHPSNETEERAKSKHYTSISKSTEFDTQMPSETIKMVGLRRNLDEPLGLTVELDEHDQLMVARILAGGMIDRQGLLHPGDVILEVNGVPVGTPEQLQEQISVAKESLTLKIGPSLDEEMKSARLTMSGGQVKNARNVDTAKKVTVSTKSAWI